MDPLKRGLANARHSVVGTSVIARLQDQHAASGLRSPLPPVEEKPPAATVTTARESLHSPALPPGLPALRFSPPRPSLVRSWDGGLTPLKKALTPHQ